MRHLFPIPQPNTQSIHLRLHLPHLITLHATPVQNLARSPHLHPLDELEPQHLWLPHPFSQYNPILTPPPLHPGRERLLHIGPNHNRAGVPHAGDDLIPRLLFRLTQRLEIPVQRRHFGRQPRGEVDVVPAHGLEPTALLDVFPTLDVCPVHDEARTIGIGQQDRGEDLLARDRRYGMALSGTDAPVRGVGGRVGAGPGGVGFDLVALFVVGGDDGLEPGEIDF